MNIVFKKLRYKNLLSTGNVFTEIILDSSKTTLISGANGAGKSSMMDALVYALYAKPFRKINKPQLMNSINQKELLVELEFAISKNEYLIRRGMRPNIFEIWKNEVLINQDAASRDYQEYLEQNILKMNFKSFNQIVILGSATYVPFMELPTGSRREIIEDLLDIQIFTTMNVLLKEKIVSNKTQISDNKYEIDLLNSKIESAKENSESIRKLKVIELDKIKEKVAEHIHTIETNTLKIEEIETQITEKHNLIFDKPKTKSKKETLISLKYDLETKKKSFEKELHFYHDHNNCPTCKQGIDIDFKKHVIDEKTLKSNEIDLAFTQMIQKLDELEARLEAISLIEDEIAKRHSQANELRVSIKISKNALSNYRKDMERAEKEVEEIDVSKIKDFNKQLKKVQRAQEALFEHREILSTAASMLKDGGIKTRIIRQYVPIMNKLINKYLSAFDLFVDFHLDDSFNEVIKSRFRDTFSYASFSEGEKLRINMSIMLTWRAVSKLRNSVSTNLLILDETLDGSLDGTGIESLIDTLHNLNSNDNIFVISHRGSEFQDKFESHIRFEKVKNFSQLAQTIR